MENKFKPGDIVQLRPGHACMRTLRDTTIVGLVTPEGALLPLVLENALGWKFGVARTDWVPRAFKLAPDETLVQLGSKKPAPVETARVQVHGWYVVQDGGDLPQDMDRMVEWITAIELNRVLIARDTATGEHMRKRAQMLHADYATGIPVVLWRYADS
jgi:hypothetical protein